MTQATEGHPAVEQGEILAAPLTPAACDLRNFPFMALDVQRLRDSGLTAKATGDEFRAAVLLWCASWHQVPAASLPDDDDELANICGYSRARTEWAKVRDGAMRGWLRCSDGRLYHRVVASKALEAWIEKLGSAIGGAIGNAKRWNVDIDIDVMRAQFRQAVDSLRAIDPGSATLRKRLVATHTMASPPDSPPDSPSDSPPDSPSDRKRQGQGQGQGEGQGQGQGQQGLKTAATPAPSPAPEPPAADAAAKRGTRLSPDWHLPKAWGMWAQEQYAHWTPDTIRTVATKFRNHWVAKSGKDATKLDWYATWQNWCMSDITQRENPPPKQAATPEDAEARRQARIAEMRRVAGASAIPAPNDPNVIDA